MKKNNHLINNSFIFLVLVEFLFGQIINISPTSLAYKNEAIEDDEPNLMKGWLRFFTFVPDFISTDMPRKFEYNQAYKDQFSNNRHPEYTEKDKDEFGFYNIPTDTSFFFVITRKTLYVINARRVYNDF